MKSNGTVQNEKRMSEYGSAVLADGDDDLVNLKRTVGLAGGISLIAGSMIGELILKENLK